MLYEPAQRYARRVDYRYALHIMHEHVTHVHLKDGMFTLQGFQYTTLGQGQIDYQWILSQLQRRRHRGDLAAGDQLQEPPAEAGLAQWYEAGVALLQAAGVGTSNHGDTEDTESVFYRVGALRVSVVVPNLGPT